MNAYESFDDMAEALELPSAADVWRDGWVPSQRTFPAGLPLFLTEESVRTACTLVGLGEEPRAALLRHRMDFAGDERLCRLAWHLFRKLTDSPGMLRADVRLWPLLPRSTVPGADLFFGYLFLGTAARLAAWYGSRGIPRAIFLATLADLDLWMREHRRRTGRWGLSEHKWLVHHFSGNIFQLGRLQFQFGTCRYRYHAWRHREDGRLLLLAGRGLRFNDDGFAAGTSAQLEREADYAVDDRCVSGLPIDPRGFARAAPVELAKSDWECVLEAGDPVLNLHIPAGSPMDFERCGDAFAQARAFFATYFPRFEYRAFLCGSWLLDPQLEEGLDETSNIARFLREVYLFPLPDAGDHAILNRVFGHSSIDVHSAPRDTSLRRAVLDHMLRGGQWRSGGCLLLPDDLDWGRQVYRRRDRAAGAADRLPGRRFCSAARQTCR